MDKTYNNIIIDKLSKKFKLPMATVEEILKDIGDIIFEKKEIMDEEQVKISSGIMTFDNITKITPGITLIYGRDSSGKSAIAKSVARISHKRGFNVLYVDTEGKATKSDHEKMSGVFYSTSTEAQAIHKILHYRLIDVMVVDSLTAMLPQSQKYLIHHARRTVPYIIATSQMRYDMKNNIMVPACWDETKSNAKLHISLEDPTNILEGKNDYTRYKFAIMKSQDQGIVGEASAFVVKNNWVKNSYTSFDLLNSINLIERYGNAPVLNNKVIDIEIDYQDIIKEALKILKLNEPAETYY